LCVAVEARDQLGLWIQVKWFWWTGLIRIQRTDAGKVSLMFISLRKNVLKLIASSGLNINWLFLFYEKLEVPDGLLQAMRWAESGWLRREWLKCWVRSLGRQVTNGGQVPHQDPLLGNLNFRRQRLHFFAFTSNNACQRVSSDHFLKHDLCHRVQHRSWR